MSLHDLLKKLDTPIAPRQSLESDVDEYLSEKCTRQIFENDNHHLYYMVRGIKPQMWFRVVKPELKRLAEKRHYYIHMILERPKANWLEFEFVALPAERPRPAKSQVPQLTAEELRDVREMLREFRWSRKIAKKK